MSYPPTDGLHLLDADEFDIHTVGSFGPLTQTDAACRIHEAWHDPRKEEPTFDEVVIRYIEGPMERAEDAQKAGGFLSRRLTIAIGQRAFKTGRFDKAEVKPVLNKIGNRIGIVQSAKAHRAFNTSVKFYHGLEWAGKAFFVTNLVTNLAKASRGVVRLAHETQMSQAQLAGMSFEYLAMHLIGNAFVSEAAFWGTTARWAGKGMAEFLHRPYHEPRFISEFIDTSVMVDEYLSDDDEFYDFLKKWWSKH